MKIIRPIDIGYTVNGGISRNSPATYINEFGNLSMASSGQLRRTYKYNKTRDSWEFFGILLEGASENLAVSLKYSDWSYNNLTDTAEIEQSPISDSNDVIVFVRTDNTLNYVELFKTFSSWDISKTPYTTFSTIIKTTSDIQIEAETPSKNWYAKCSFNIEDNKIFDRSTAGHTDCTGEIEYLPDGYARVSMIFKNADPGFNPVKISIKLYTDNTTEKVKCGLPQLEQNKGATSLMGYYPMASVSRGEDIITGNGNSIVYSNISEDNEPYPIFTGSSTFYGTGQRVIFEHNIYERVGEPGDTVGDPERDGNNWLLVEPTNLMAPFDESPSTKAYAQNSDEIVYILRTNNINSLALLNMDANKVVVNMYTDEGSSYHIVKDLRNEFIIDDWYEYFFERYLYNSTFLHDFSSGNTGIIGLPQYTSAVICITVRKDSDIPSVGSIIFGNSLKLGGTSRGMSVGILDYSVKETNEFGNTVLVRRKHSRRIRGNIYVKAPRIDYIVDTLSSYRATPLLWVGIDDNQQAFIVYGFYRDWEILNENNILSLCSIEVEGLT